MEGLPSPAPSASPAPSGAPTSEGVFDALEHFELVLGALPFLLVLAAACVLNLRLAACSTVLSRMVRATATAAFVAALSIPAALPFDLMITFQARTHQAGGDALYDRFSPRLEVRALSRSRDDHVRISPAQHPLTTSNRPTIYTC